MNHACPLAVILAGRRGPEWRRKPPEGTITHANQLHIIGPGHPNSSFSLASGNVIINSIALDTSFRNSAATFDELPILPANTRPGLAYSTRHGLLVRPGWKISTRSGGAPPHTRRTGLIAAYLPADGAFVDADNRGDGLLRIPFLQAIGNLVSLFTGEVCVAFHRATPYIYFRNQDAAASHLSFIGEVALKS